MLELEENPTKENLQWIDQLRNALATLGTEPISYRAILKHTFDPGPPRPYIPTAGETAQAVAKALSDTFPRM
jgi:hypothetical protein